jgi:hypothetical protein
VRKWRNRNKSEERKEQEHRWGEEGPGICTAEERNRRNTGGESKGKEYRLGAGGKEGARIQLREKGACSGTVEGARSRDKGEEWKKSRDTGEGRKEQQYKWGEQGQEYKCGKEGQETGEERKEQKNRWRRGGAERQVGKGRSINTGEKKKDLEYRYGSEAAKIQAGKEGAGIQVIIERSNGIDVGTRNRDKVRKGRRAGIQVRREKEKKQQYKRGEQGQEYVLYTWGEKDAAIQVIRARTENNKNTGLEKKEQQYMYRCESNDRNTGEERKEQEHRWGKEGTGKQNRRGRTRNTCVKRKEQEYRNVCRGAEWIWRREKQRRERGKSRIISKRKKTGNISSKEFNHLMLSHLSTGLVRGAVLGDLWRARAAMGTWTRAASTVPPTLAMATSTPVTSRNRSTASQMR